MSDVPGGASPGGGWVAPDTPVDTPRAAVTGPVAPVPTPGPSGSVVGSTTGRRGGIDPDSPWTNAAGVRLPVPLRPMSVADVLDGTFGIIKARPATVLGVSAVCVLPVVLLQAVLLAGLYNPTLFNPIATVTGPDASGGAILLGSFASLLAITFAAFLVGGAQARLVSAWYMGGDLGIRAVLSALVRRLPALLAAWAIWLPLGVVSAVTGYTMVGLPLFLVVFTLSSFIAPVIVAEGLGPIDGIRRAARLAWKRFFPVMGIMVLGALMVALSLVALSGIAGYASLLTFSDGSGIWAFGGSLVTGAALILQVPLSTGISVLLYLDQRVRAEGLDIELAASEVFG